MKKWQIIVIVLICVIGAAVGGGKLFYELYLVPKYVEPIASKMQQYVNESDVIEELYDNADRLHEEGYIEDDTYEKFIKQYSKHEMKNTEVAKEIIEKAEKNEDETAQKSDENSSVTARYASKRVGVEMIQVADDDEQAGSSQTRYSTERTSDRVKSEDIVEAKKVLSSGEDEVIDDETGAVDNADDTVDTVDTKTAYQKLKDNMTAEEFATFAQIMQKMDTNTLLSLANDKEGLKEYMHSKLTDEQYKSIVNLGYKYAYVFLEE